MSVRSGTLYVVATPLGNLTDITHRALEILSQVQLIAAEDTRHSRKLLDAFNIETQCVAFHEHNEREMVDVLLEHLARGESIALISDAGTPLISDPGFPLVRAARARGIDVVPIPGPSALIAALSVSGLPTDRFVFEGFLPAKAAARRERLHALRNETRTLVFYESTHRIVASLADMREVFGAEREAVIARELTKMFETVHGGTLAELIDWLAADAQREKGEFVVMIHGVHVDTVTAPVDPDRILRVLCEELPPTRAAAVVARITGAKKSDFYTRAVEYSKKAT